MVISKTPSPKSRVSVFLFGVIAIPLLVFLFIAASEGPLSPGIASESDYGGIDWDHKNNIKASDNDYGYVSLNDGDVSDYIEATKFNFAIPVGATIDGIEVEIERKGESDAIKDDIVKLIKGGTISGTNMALDITWPSSDDVATYGGSTNLWGLAFTESDINSNSFGVAVAVKKSTTGSGAKTASIDNIRVKVYYTIVLPVELLSFNAESKENEVELTWTTAAEKNNDFYTIERSENGTSFIQVAKVDGAGNLSTKRNYTSRDTEPLQGTSYYRLVQTDFDGKSFTYPPVAVNRLIASQAPCSFRVYPNPCPGNCNVLLEDCPEGREKEITLSVFDALGNRVLSNVILRDEKGSFNFSIDTKNNLMPGVYIVQAANETEKYSNKVIVSGQ